MIASFCAKNGIEMIDLFHVFEGRPYASLWVHASDQHPNEEGHAIAAEALADFILERGLLVEKAKGSGSGASE
jgi:lysophospholipase L1-like esterase